MSLSYHINSLFNSKSYAFDGVLIDPGDTWDGFQNVSTVLITHGHFDHIYGLNNVIDKNPAVKIYTNSVGCDMLLNSKKNLSWYNESPFIVTHPENIVVIEDGYEFIIGDGLTVKAVFTPGHNPSCITWVVGDNIFTGDAYIPGEKIITNLPGGNHDQAQASLILIKELARNRSIFPGHSTI